MLQRTGSQKVDALKGIPIFAHLSKKQLGEVARRTDELVVEGGKVLAREAAAGRDLFVIVSGTATVSKHGETLATLQPGDCFGEMSLLDGQPRSATVVADGPMELLVVTSREFKPLLLGIPEIGLQLLKAMAQRLRDADEALTH